MRRYSFSYPSIYADRIEVFRKSHLKDIAYLGNYLTIFTSHEHSPNLTTIYAFTDTAHLICITLDLVKNKSGVKVITALADSVVKNTMHSITLKEGKGFLSLCILHDETQISIVNFLVKPTILSLISADRMIKTTIKLVSGLRPLTVRFSKENNYVFVCYRNHIDIYSLSYGVEGIVPLLDKLSAINLKENLVSSCIISSSSKVEYLYYFSLAEKSKETQEIPILRNPKEEISTSIVYNLRQIQITKKGINIKTVIKLEMYSKIKYIEWSNKMNKVAALLENNTVEVIMMEEILAVSEYKINPKPFKKESYSYKINQSIALKTVRWLDNDFLLIVTEDLKVFILDPCLTPLKFCYKSKYTESLPLSPITLPQIKNPAAEKFLQNEIELANKKTILKQPLINEPDPLIISGNLPYNLIIYKLYLSFPIQLYDLTGEHLLFQYLDNGKIGAALKLLMRIEESDVFLKCFTHVANYLMRQPKVLANNKVLSFLLKLHEILEKANKEQLLIRLKQYYTKLGQRLLTSDYYEEAFQIAFTCKLLVLMRNIEQYCKWKKREVMAEVARREAIKYNPNTSTLSQELMKVLEWTNKALTEEEMQSIVDDYKTLISVEGIHELGLSEFNSWGVDLDDYKKALELELDGKYEEAKVIYEKNKFFADVERVERLANLTKELDQGITQFTKTSEILN